MEMRRILNAIFWFGCLLGAVADAAAAPSQALGYKPAYPPGFDHFHYVNPAAPKGGAVTISSIGSFDTLNPFTLKGMADEQLTQLVFESLMEPSLDEPYSQYGLLADDVEEAPDGMSVTFHLNPKARFSDGTPVTAADVVFSFNTLKSKQAKPQFRFYYADILRARALNSHTVRFYFARRNPELPMIAGQFPIFSRHWVGKALFGQLALKPPIASGPYVVGKYRFGKYITYRRNPDYWARDLNVRRGMYNFDRITVKYYRDSTVALEGFKADDFDFMAVYNSKQWARDYVGKKFDEGLIKKAELVQHNDAGMQGFVFNLRRSLFQDRRVRRAIDLAFDFQWANRMLFYGQYKRCYSYFSNSDLAASGIPHGAELKLLEPYRKLLPPKLFTTPWTPPTTAPPHSLRDNLKKAKALLEAAGWHYRDGALRNASGQPFVFGILLSEGGFERIVAPFARNLAILGIQVNYRVLDPAVYQRRVNDFDFDMLVQVLPESQSPGNELTGMFTSAAADQEGTRNLMGLKNPVVDALVNKVIYAKDRAHLVTAVHALDRVLLYGEYVVPNWFIAKHRIAYWNRFGMPKILPLYYQPASWMLATWWSRSDKAVPK